MKVVVGIRVPALHEVLWSRRNADDCIQVRQRDLAGELGVTRARVGHVLARMEREGRIKRLAEARGPYVVSDPAGFS